MSGWHGTVRSALAVMGLVVGVVVVPAGPAQAGVGIGTSLTMPTGVRVGNTGDIGSFTVRNQNTAPDLGTNTVTQMQLTLACGAAGNPGTPCSLPDLGVFTVTAATGAAGTACAGVNFTRSAPDATGAVTLTPPAPVVLAAPSVTPGPDRCTVNFTFNVLKMPSIDADPATVGVQTYAKLRVTATGPQGLQVTAGGSTRLTVVKASPHLTSQVTSPSVAAGGTISASASAAGIAGFPLPTGTMTFAVYGPDDATCSGPVFAQSQPVPLVNGTAQSPQFAVTQPGTYRFTTTYSGDATYVGAATSCTDPSSLVNVTAVSGGAYRPLSPARIVDSRFGPGTIGPIPANGERTITVVGVGGVPATGVSAVALNVVATNTAASGYFTVYPAGAARPNAANLNWDAGETVPNLVEMPVGAGGQVTVFNGSPGAADIVVDVSGWVATPAASTGADGLYNPVVPTRLADTRPASPIGPSGPLAANGTMSVTVAGPGQVAGNPVPAAGVGAVVLNVTVVDPAAGGYLTVFPAGEARPLAANLNFLPGQVVPNRVIVKVGAGGQVSIFNGSAGAANVVVDVGGWFTNAASAAGGARFTGLAAPTRITDTRPAPFRIGPNATLGPNGEITVAVALTPGLPAGDPPRAVVLNVAVTNPTATGFLTVYPADAARPLAADQNWPPGDTRSNLVVVKLSAGGAIKLFNGSPGTLDVVIDVIGWYA